MQMSIFPGLRSVTLAAGVLSLSAAAAGCAYGTTKQVVRAQFSAELSCPDARVEPSKRYDEAFKEGQLKASGCGVTRLYDCPAEAGLVSYDDDVCTFTVVSENRPKQAAPPPDTMDQAQADDPALEASPADEPAPLDEPAAMETAPLDEPAAEPSAEAAPEPKATPKASGKAKAGKGKASGKLKVGFGK